MVCRGSVLLPHALQAPSAGAALGSRRHEILRDLLATGDRRLVVSDTAEVRAWAEGLDAPDLLERITPPAGVAQRAITCEIAMAWDAEIDATRVLGVDRGRDYGALGPDEIAGTADLIYLDVAHGTAAVVDWKTGHAPEEEAWASWQIRTLALMVARSRGLGSIDGALVYLRDSGAVHVSRARFDAIDLDSIASMLRRLVRELHELARTGAAPPVVEGHHCRWCPAYAGCPAKRSLALAVAGEQDLVELTPERAGAAWSRLLAAEELLRRVRSTLLEYGRDHELMLPGGRRVHAVQVSREAPDAAVAAAVLGLTLGAEAAERAVVRSTSWAAIERAIRAHASASGERPGPIIREIRAAIAERGGVVRTTSVAMRDVREEEEEEEEVGP